MFRRAFFVIEEMLGALRASSMWSSAPAQLPADLESFESRILFSASPLVVADGADLVTRAQTADSWQAPGDCDGCTEGATDLPRTTVLSEIESHLEPGEGEPSSIVELDHGRREFVFIDEGIGAVELLLADLGLSSEHDREFEWFLLDEAQDGVDRIAQVLSGATQVDAVHIVSHAADGQLQLGNSWLSVANEHLYRDQFANWRGALSADADLLFYGCQLAAGSAGVELLTTLSEWTGAAVAASTDHTGHTELAGNWELEFVTGDVVTPVAFSEEAQQAWHSVLGQVTVDTATDLIDGDVSSISALIAAPGGDGQISLREAIHATNATSGHDTIAFDIAGSGPHEILLDTALPQITDAVTIDGFTQAGAVANSLVVGNDAQLQIEISGANLIGGNGLSLSGNGASGSIVRGLVIRDMPGNAIDISSASDVRIEGSFIGTNRLGDTAAANGASGIRLNLTNGTVIGGSHASARNLISGNAENGVEIVGASAVNTRIEGNYIGTDRSGSFAVGNSRHGVFFASTTRDTVGGSVQGAGNLISGNNRSGIAFEGSSNIVVTANLIGTDATGAVAIANQRYGIEHAGAASSQMDIGGSTPQQRNVISGNQLGGLLIAGTGNELFGNYIGTDATGTQGIGNGIHGGIMLLSGNRNVVGGTLAGQGNVISHNLGPGVSVRFTATSTEIRGNSFHSNTGLPIDLGFDGPTLNDALDVDGGPNGLRNYPEISSATVLDGDLVVNGTYQGKAGETISVDLYATTGSSPVGHADIGRYLGTLPFTTSPITGAAEIRGRLLGVSVSPGEWISATVTDHAGNTSEYSPRCSAQLPDVSIAASPTTIIVDGMIDSSWAVTQPLTSGFLSSGAIRTADDFGVQWRSLWTDSHLYFLVQSVDDSLQGDSPADPSEDDSIEIMLDLDLSRSGAYDGRDDYHLVLHADSGLLSTGSNSVADLTGFQSAVLHTAQGYSAELAIPWTALGAAPSPGAFIGLEVVANDDDDGGAKDAQLAWHDATGFANSDTTLFGIGVLTDVPNSPPVAEAGGTYVIDEGSPVTLDGSGSFDADGGALTYAWDLDGNAIFGETGEPTTDQVTVAWSALFASGIVNDGTYTIGLRVTDTEGASSTDIATLVILNVSPSQAPAAFTALTGDSVGDGSFGQGGDLPDAIFSPPATAAFSGKSTAASANSSAVQATPVSSDGDPISTANAASGSSGSSGGLSAITQARRSASAQGGLAGGGLANQSSSTGVALEEELLSDDLLSAARRRSSEANLVSGFHRMSPPGTTSVTLVGAWLNQDGLFARELDSLGETVDQWLQFQDIRVGSIGAITTSLTAGYVAWMIRGGIVASTLLAQLPAWKYLDALVVLAHAEGNDNDEEQEDRSLQSIVDQDLDDPTNTEPATR